MPTLGYHTLLQVGFDPQSQVQRQKRKEIPPSLLFPADTVDMAHPAGYGSIEHCKTRMLVVNRFWKTANDPFEQVWVVWDVRAAADSILKNANDLSLRNNCAFGPPHVESHLALGSILPTTKNRIGGGDPTLVSMAFLKDTSRDLSNSSGQSSKHNNSDSETKSFWNADDSPSPSPATTGKLACGKD